MCFVYLISKLNKIQIKWCKYKKSINFKKKSLVKIVKPYANKMRVQFINPLRLIQCNRLVVNNQPNLLCSTKFNSLYHPILTKCCSTINIKAHNKPIERIRNIGISAHIDSGKTTLTERLLYYSGRIEEMHEVKGKDKIGAVMDSMELERQRGITIQSAATYIDWKNHNVNIIDTPGHVDFTVEVERALRVLDAAVLVLCSVGGVQAQTLTVTRQMNRYNVPCIAFINKLDRQNANHLRVIQQIKERIGFNAAFVNIPIGLESNNIGVVDIIKNKAIYFEGPGGTILREAEVPENLVKERELRKQELIEALSNVDDKIGELFLNEKPIEDDALCAAIRRQTIARQFVPVLTGTALKNRGVQPLLDAILDYLPNPTEIDNYAILYDDEGNEINKLKMNTERSKKLELLALAFKNESGKYGKLTYFRIYQGCIKKGDFVRNTRTERRLKVPRLVRIHSNQIEDVTEAYAGDIVGLTGIDCGTGDTFIDSTSTKKVSMEPIFIPQPVISMSVQVKDRNKADQFSKALSRYTSEDPTLHRHWEQESREHIISGMGELHLEIYAQRIEREYNCPVELAKPKVAFRETIVKPCKFDYLHKRQSGGRGQYGRVTGWLEPLPAKQYTEVPFSNETLGTNVPRQFVPSIERGYRASCEKGPLSGHKIAGVKFRLQDGDNHSVDSSDISFVLAAQGAMENTFQDGVWTVLEPIMLVEVTCPIEYQTPVTTQIVKRNGIVQSMLQGNELYTLICEVPLNDMFGYATELRITTQGQGEYTQEFVRYAPAREDVKSKLAKEYQAKLESLEKRN